MINFYEHMAPVYWDVYEDFMRLNHREYWFKGGRGSGKSSFIALAIIGGMLRDRDACCVAYRRVANTLKDSVYAVFGWAVRQLGLERLFRFKLSPLEIVFLPTGQKILFRGADDPVKSKSLALRQGYFKYLWFEEIAEFRGEEDVRTIVQSVLRGADKGAMICSYNPPKSALSWVNEAALTPACGRLVTHSTYLDMPKKWLGERFLQEAEALKSRSERAYLNEYLGQVTGSGGQVFENIVSDSLSDEALSRFGRRFFGLDFGFARDPDALTQWAYDKKRSELYAVSEHVKAGQSPETLAERVKAISGRHAVYCDSADPRMISVLKSLGVNAVAVKKGPGSREQGFRWLQTLSAIHIDPKRTPVTYGEFTGCEYRRDAAGRFVSGYPDENDHTIDSCRYALEREISLRQAGTRRDVY